MTVQEALRVVALIETGDESIEGLASDEVTFMLMMCKDLSVSTRKELEYQFWNNLWKAQMREEGYPV